MKARAVVGKNDMVRSGNWSADFWSDWEIAGCYRELTGLEAEGVREALAETLATIPTVFGPAAQAWLRETHAVTSSLAVQLADLFKAVAAEEAPMRPEAARRAVAANRFDGVRLLLAASVVCALKRRFLRQESLEAAEKAVPADIEAAFARLEELEAAARGMSSRHVRGR